MESGEVQIPNIKPIDRKGGWDKDDLMLMGAMGHYGGEKIAPVHINQKQKKTFTEI